MGKDCAVSNSRKQEVGTNNTYKAGDYEESLNNTPYQYPTLQNSLMTLEW